MFYYEAVEKAKLQKKKREEAKEQKNIDLSGEKFNFYSFKEAVQTVRDFAD